MILKALAQTTGAKVPPRLPVMRDPRHLEGGYHKRMREGPINDAHSLLVQRLNDGTPLAEATEGARQEHRSRWTDAIIAAVVIAGVFRAVSAFHATQLNRVLAAFLKLDLPLVGNELDLATALAAATRDNVELIRSLSDTYYDAVSKSGDLDDAYGITDRRAAIIAQDQVQKFFGRLNQERQQRLGIERYTWETMLDERVRSGHRARHGTVWSWSEEPPDAGGGPGHPGIPVNCRCVAVPVLEDVEGSVQ